MPSRRYVVGVLFVGDDIATVFEAHNILFEGEFVRLHVGANAWKIFPAHRIVEINYKDVSYA